MLSQSHPKAWRLDGSMIKIVRNLVLAHAGNHTIMAFLELYGITVKSQDITNIRMMVSKADSFHDLVDGMRQRGFVIQHTVEQDMVFFAYNKVVHLLQQQQDVVVSIDATYQTTSDMPIYINVVVTGHVGYPKLKTLVVAGGWVKKETNQAYEWFIGELKKHVFYNTTPIFVTDQEPALAHALDKHFSLSPKLLCNVHVHRLLKNKLNALFDDTTWKSFQQGFKQLVAMDHHHQESGMTMVPDERVYKEALAIMYKAADRSQNPQAVKDAMNEMLERRHQWVGYYTSRFTHYGTTTTNRAEGMHADLKRRLLSTRSNLSSTLEQVGNYFKQKVRGWIQAVDEEMLSFPTRLPDRVSPLFGHVSRFAIFRICNELKVQNVLPMANCACSTRIVYGLPCCHLLADGLPVTVDKVDTRWYLHHLDGDDDDDDDDMEVDTFDDVESTTNSNMDTLHDTITDTLNKLNTLQQNMDDPQQLSSILTRLMDIVNDVDTKRSMHDDDTNIHPLLPIQAITSIHNPLGDGNCGFRAIAHDLYGSEHEYMQVKQRMQQHFMQHVDWYPEYDNNQIISILNPSSSDWFCYPGCCQIAADAFLVPAAFYSDDTSSIFFSLQATPQQCNRTHPLVLYHTTGTQHIQVIQLQQDFDIQ